MANPLKILRDMVFPRRRGGVLLLPRTSFDYASEIGDGTRSNIVQAVVRWIARTFPEAPVVVVEYDANGQKTILHGHDVQRLIERPNPYYSGVLLWAATIADWALTANAYWIKVRDRGGRVAQLWWTPSWMIEPVGDERIFIDHYDYRPNAEMPAIRLEVSDVVHFRDGMDPRNPRKGLSALQSLYREIFTDEEAANFTAALMRNLGVPGVVLSPRDARVTTTEETAAQMREEFRARYGGDRRGEPLILNAPVDVTVLSFTPEQMTLRELRRIPEERVTAIFGVAAVVVGLGAGLDRSTFTNFAEAREAAYEQYIIPTQRLIAADLTSQLLVDFDRAPNRQMEFDLSHVRVLADDENRLYERLRTAVVGGSFMTRAEARREAGLPVGPGDDVYLVPMNLIEVPRMVRQAQAGAGKSAKTRGAGLRRVRAEHIAALERTAAVAVARESQAYMRIARRTLRGKSIEDFASALESFLSEYEPELRDLMAGPLTAVMQDAMKAAAAAAGSQPTASLDSFIAAYLSAAVNRWLGSSHGQVLSVVGGASLDGIDPIDALRGRLDEWEASRPAKWAAWEASQATNAAANQTYVLAGVERKVWVASANACQFCASLDGATIEVERQFVLPGDSVEVEGETLLTETGLGHPPAHNGCDCIVMPEIETFRAADRILQKGDGRWNLSKSK